MGAFQSPIDIGRTIASPELRYLEFDYDPTGLEIMLQNQIVRAKPVDLIRVRFEEQTYFLDEIRFHTPSEHRIKGEPHDGEIQLIHRNERGEILAVSILVWEGSRLPAFDVIKAKIPRKEGSKKILVGFDIRNLLPKKRRYFRYSGSMTTPPCQEGVTWVIFQSAIQLSGHQIDQLTLAQGKNNRPPQPLGNRIPLRSR
ncbi:carbonic anhydrase family protein [Pseudobacteriovorax antillogorgiicola]|uniref:carbonic anhydrase n=1 Tax=Pseudobacteriovorax antillogorgiicola TaxID=1513793 RepID=A0A1Y6CQ01_9BACT|nr:carbonic anhydrase family protein [Pseudobacteriovorax antillogorgiicola]TCS42240.1 carbonic anhydrase [Pseudobacteriovorax antillogorgiicola]SMF82558.1 carbonic anhydrase [Pseudobacteriovorax antillogorgiicola]